MLDVCINLNSQRQNILVDVTVSSRKYRSIGTEEATCRIVDACQSHPYNPSNSGTASLVPSLRVRDVGLKFHRRT